MSTDNIPRSDPQSARQTRRPAALSAAMNQQAHSIRPATPADAESLAVLVQALNEHLNEEANKITPEILKTDVLVEGSLHDVFVAEGADGALVGYALYHESFDSAEAARGLYMADLFVSEAARGQGLGRALVASVAGEAKRRGLRYVWWLSEDDDANAHGFYGSLGASQERFAAHALTEETFQKLAAESKL